MHIHNTANIKVVKSLWKFPWFFFYHFVFQSRIKSLTRFSWKFSKRIMMDYLLNIDNNITDKKTVEKILEALCGETNIRTGWILIKWHPLSSPLYLLLSVFFVVVISSMLFYSKSPVNPTSPPTFSCSYFWLVCLLTPRK